MFRLFSKDIDFFRKMNKIHRKNPLRLVESGEKPDEIRAKIPRFAAGATAAAHTKEPKTHIIS